MFALRDAWTDPIHADARANLAGLLGYPDVGL